jgi:hypothetical protein
MDNHGRRSRPALWVAGFALVALSGLGVGLTVAPTLLRLGKVDGAPACATDFAEGCTTQRAAVLRSPDSSSLAGKRRWWARVPDGTPDAVDGPNQERLHVPRQDGQEELAAGMRVTLVYFGDSPAWIRLPSGAMLETADHPRWKAPGLAWMALAMIGFGIFGVRTGIRSARAGGGWLQPTPTRVRAGPEVVLFFAGGLGALAVRLVGGIVWPGVVGGLLGAGFGVLLWVLAWRAARRRRAAHG